MEKAAFRFLGYRFTKISLDFTNIDLEQELSIDISTLGTYISNLGKFELKFIFTAFNSQNEEEVVKIECISQFAFSDKIAYESIPGYFYPNSIAIVFPYVRAFISSISVQAGIPPIVLPTYNLSVLQEELKKNTLVIDNEKEETLSSSRG